MLAVGLSRPLLELQQLDLQEVLLDVVLLAVEALVVGVVLAPGLDGVAQGVDEVGVRALVVTHGVPLVVQGGEVLTEVLLHGISSRVGVCGEHRRRS